MSVRIPEKVSIRALARLLKVSERTIRRWQNPQLDKSDDAPRSPIPFTKVGNATLFPLEACIAWFVDYRTSIASRSVSELDLARQRKVTADAEIAELDLAQRRGELVPASAYRSELADTVARIRAQLLASPGRYSARTVGMMNLIDSTRVWDGAVRDILSDLARGNRSA
jgi:hypothetical protein